MTHPHPRIEELRPARNRHSRRSRGDRSRSRWRADGFGVHRIGVCAVALRSAVVQLPDSGGVHVGVGARHHLDRIFDDLLGNDRSHGRRNSDGGPPCLPAPRGAPVAARLAAGSALCVVRVRAVVGGRRPQEKIVAGHRAPDISGV